MTILEISPGLPSSFPYTLLRLWNCHHGDTRVLHPHAKTAYHLLYPRPPPSLLLSDLMLGRNLQTRQRQHPSHQHVPRRPLDRILPSSWRIHSLLEIRNARRRRRVHSALLWVDGAKRRLKTLGLPVKRAVNVWRRSIIHGDHSPTCIISSLSLL